MNRRMFAGFCPNRRFNPLSAGAGSFRTGPAGEPARQTGTPENCKPTREVNNER